MPVHAGVARDVGLQAAVAAALCHQFGVASVESLGCGPLTHVLHQHAAATEQQQPQEEESKGEGAGATSDNLNDGLTRPGVLYVCGLTPPPAGE